MVDTYNSNYHNQKQYICSDLILSSGQQDDTKNNVSLIQQYASTVYSGYSGHVYSGHSDIVVTFPSTKYIYSIIFRSDIVASRI